MSRVLRVALIQARPVGDRLDHPGNPGHAAELLEEACGMGDFDLAVFPEYFPFHGSGELGEAAAGCGVYVVAGVRREVGGAAYNTATLYGPRGEVVGWQGKRYVGRLEVRLWGFRGWRGPYRVFEVNGVKVGVAVCADFWAFPEASYELFLAGAEVFVNPSYMFSLEGHWHRATLVRSLDFYMPVVGVDTAAFPLRTRRAVFSGGGRSHVIVPPSTPEEAEDWWTSGARDTEGWVRLRLGVGEEIALYEIPVDAVNRMRRDWWRRMKGLSLEEWLSRARGVDG